MTLTRPADRGIALIMVIVILLALVAIATPFAVSMQLQEKTSRTLFTRAQAKILGEGARNYAVARLYRTHETLEKSGEYEPPFNTPDWDTVDEFKVEMDLEAQADLKGKLDVKLTDPRGLLWHVEVQDEQSKVNLNSVTPWSLGNLLGSAILTEALTEDASTVELDDASSFYSDGDPGTVDGYVLIEREAVSYTNIDGNTLCGCERGQLRDLFFVEPASHKANNLVVDFRAFKSAFFPIASAGALRPYQDLMDLKKLSSVGPQGEGLTGFSPSEIDRVIPYLTVHSHRELQGGWSSPYRVNEVRNQDQSEQGDVLIVGSGRAMSPGTLIKISRKVDVTPGDDTDSSDSEISTEYALVTWNQPSRDGWQIFLDRKLQMIWEEGDSWEACPQMRHPVNVNTASRRVLMSLLTGLKRRVDMGSDNAETGEEVRPSVCVTTEEAEAVVDKLVNFENSAGNHVVRCHEDLEQALLEMVEEGTLTESSCETILWNARFPNDYRMIVSTAPFCYKSFDTYTLEVSAVVNADSGKEQANYRFREVVQLSPPQAASLTLESQYDFQQKIWAPQGRQVCTWPEPVSIRGVTPDLSRDLEFGDVRLESARMHGGASARQVQRISGGSAFVLTRSSGQTAYVEHFDRQLLEGFDMTPEGPVLKGQGLAFEAGKTRFGADPGNRNRDSKAGTVEMWFKPKWSEGPEKHVLFDMAEDPSLQFTNRITMFYEPAQGELVFRMADGTFEPTAAEVRFEATTENLKEDTWYHLAASWKSTRYGEMSLFLDGRPVGRFVHRNQNGDTTVTFLSQDLQGGPGDDISVESTNGFPPAGVLIIGKEVIEYSGITGQAFVYDPYPEFDPDAQATQGSGSSSGTGSSGVHFPESGLDRQDGPSDDPGGSGDPGGSDPGGADPGGDDPGDGDTGSSGQGFSQDVRTGRGKRGTLAVFHPQGAAVTIFGFATDLDSKIPAGGATLSFDLGEKTQTRIFVPMIDDNGSSGGSGVPGGGGTTPGGSTPGEGGPTDRFFQDPGGPITIPPLVLASDNKLKVKSTEGFPEKGYLIMFRFERTDAGGSTPGGTTPGGGSTTPGGSGPSDIQDPGGGGASDGPSGGGSSGGGSSGGGTASASQVTIQYEYVYYDSKDDEKFKDVERGLFGTSAQDFDPLWVYVSLISVPISSKEDYPVTDNRVQIDNEWFAYDEITDKDGQVHLVRSKNDVIEKLLDQGRENETETTEELDPENPDAATDDAPDFSFNFRKRNRTLRAEHTSGASVVPVFKTKDPICGRFDAVTIITQEGKSIAQRDVAQLNWADLEYAAFTACLEKAFEAKNTRLLKFPSGETAGQLDGSVSVCQGLEGEGTPGMVDEVKFATAGRGLYRLAGAITDSDSELQVEVSVQGTVQILIGQAGGTTPQPIAVNMSSSSLPDCGVIKVGDEIIGYSEKEGETLKGLKRGLMGTAPKVHDDGEFVMNLAFLTASALNEGVSDKDNRVPLKSVREFPWEGYVLVNEEMIGFRRKDANNLVVPSENPDSPGLFRGAFGTHADAHAGGDLAILMPFRYFDGFRPLADVPELVYFQTSFAARGAYWDRITWDQDIPEEMYQAIVVYARVDGKPDWNAEPTNRPGGLYRFTDPEGENILGVQGDSIEVRAYFQYKDGAFNSDAWKASPKLKNFEVRYAQPLTVMKHEELGR